MEGGAKKTARITKASVLQIPGLIIKTAGNSFNEVVELNSSTEISGTICAIQGILKGVGTILCGGQKNMFESLKSGIRSRYKPVCCAAMLASQMSEVGLPQCYLMPILNAAVDVGIRIVNDEGYLSPTAICFIDEISESPRYSDLFHR